VLHQVYSIPCHLKKKRRNFVNPFISGDNINKALVLKLNKFPKNGIKK
jgi:hypothetical protein